MKKNIPQQKGFVILFAILISVIILLLGMGIFSVATKESILSSSAREAQYAFAAADTGSECALHAEYRTFFTTIGSHQFVCADESVVWDITQLGTFDGYISIDNTTTCAHINVSTSGTSRTIKSQGYNLCNTSGQPQLGNPRLVERDLEITYAIPGQLMQMQVQTPPQDLVIPKFLPVSDSSAQTAQVNTSNTTPDSISPIKTASQSIARTAQSVADVVDSAFRAVVNLVR